MVIIPKIELVSSNKQVSNDSFPRLKMDTGETALVVFFDPQPEVEFVHTLRAPVLNPDGTVATETKKTQKGEEYTATVTEFVGMHRCFGNFDTLSERGVDPKNCVTCKAAQDGQGIDPPQRRYAMHILRYGMNGNKLRSPFSVEVQAWTFAGKKFDDLVDMAETWGDLRQHDVALKCVNKMYQNIDMSVRPDAQWLANDERKDLAVETFKQNRHPNLSDLIARTISKDQAEDDIARVQRKVAQASGRDVPDPLSERTANIEADVSNLLGENNSTKESSGLDVFAPTPAESESITDWDDLFKSTE